ncbi:MAG: molybdate ABC transporter substrate-binding protein [Alphaproteobacteria bacterium]|jgi:molybdate transport system substrate-binding protein|nr:molybdate ABC transporter substrate-binding protein [Alphaproteobacteria bacterium]
MKLLNIFIFTILFFSKCYAEINIAVAANMKGTADLLIKEFNKNHDIKINVISASSGELFHQISNSAPFQLFISADTNYPDMLVKNNLTTDDPYIYAYGLLVIALANKNIEINDITDINNKKISYIAIANPNLAPYGKVAMEILKEQNLYDKIKDKIILGNSINEVNQLVFSKSVDIAFTNKSALVLDKSLKYYEIPTNLYSPIPQSLVLIKTNNKKVAQEAKMFYDFLKSIEAKKILINSGYLVK